MKYVSHTGVQDFFKEYVHDFGGQGMIFNGFDLGADNATLRECEITHEI